MSLDQGGGVGWGGGGEGGPGGSDPLISHIFTVNVRPPVYQWLFVLRRQEQIIHHFIFLSVILLQFGAGVNPSCRGQC